MNILPSELLHDIFIHLPIIQQLQCMLVSRRWADIIYGQSLYHSVYIRNEEMFQYFLKTIKQKPELANNVEHLVLSRDGPSDISEKDILELFPNLKTLDYSRFNNPHIEKDTLNDYTSPLPLKNKLTYVGDTSKCFMTRLGLEEGLFTHLITLDLSFPIEYDYKRNPLLPLLKNMPVLKYLRLNSTTITIVDFEILHANIPSLESLKISDIRLILSNFPAKIKPTSAFTSLEVYGEFEDPQTKYDWFKYIIEKYPRLAHLVYSIGDWIPEDFDKSSLVLRADSRDVIRKLGPQLQTLSYYDDMDILCEEIGTSRQKWNLKKMIVRQSISQGQLASLVQLYQFKFVENLELCIARLPFPLAKLKEMVHLKVLRLTFYQEDITPSDDTPESGLENNKSAVLNLDELFRYLPSSVESVHLYCRYAGFDDDDNGTQYINIKKLILEVLEPQKKIDEFITKRLPNLYSLILTDCFQLGETLNFPNHQFSFLKIHSYRRSIINVCITTDDLKTEHYYTTNSGYFHQYAEFNDFMLIASSEGLDDSQVLFLTCCSVKRLVLGSPRRFSLDALLIPF